MDAVTFGEMLRKYYEGPYSHGERNRLFVEVITNKGKKIFVSIHSVAQIASDKNGYGIVIDRHNHKTKTSHPYIELGMLFELAGKRSIERNPERAPRKDDQPRNARR